MAVVDQQGRVFGRINLIDLAVGLFLFALIPVAYGAYALFHQPEPRLLSIAPAKLTPWTTHVRIRGEHLRPYLRVSFNDFQGATFGLIMPDLAEVRVPALPAGTYDVVLYDVAREVSRLSRAVEVEAAPLPSTDTTMLVAGSFVALDPSTSRDVQKGRRFGAMGGNSVEVIDVGEPQTDSRPVLPGDTVVDVPLKEGKQVPVLLRATCTIVERRCQVGGTDLEPNHVLGLFTEDGKPLRFIVAEAFAEGTPVEGELLVRFVLPAESANSLRAGDRDRGHPLLGGTRATVVAVSAPRRVVGNTTWQALIPGVPTRDATLEVPDGASTVDATLRASLDRARDGFRYRGRAVKTGAPFVLETDRYVLRGWLLRVGARGDTRP